MENAHLNHRKRMKTKYEKHGEEVFETYQLLEMLLYGFISRADTNPTAHEVLDRCRGTEIFSASREELTKIPGVGDKTAVGLKLSADTVRRMICDILESSGLNNDFKRRMYVYLRFLGKPYESVYVMYLSQKDRVLEWAKVPGGVRDPSDFAKELSDRARLLGADKTILCHSHGKNSPEASVEDLYITEYVRKKLEGTGVCLAEQYIVTETDCVPCTQGKR